MSRALLARMDALLWGPKLWRAMSLGFLLLGSASTCFLQDILYRVWTLTPSPPSTAAPHRRVSCRAGA